MLRLPAVTFLLLGLACAGAGKSSPDAPEIVQFTADAATVDESGSVTFSAVVTDPNGVDDVIGGTLGNGDGATYGAFATSGDAGTYALTLSWDEISETEAFVFEGSDTRSFVATFFDQEGHEATASVTVAFTCSTGAACDGACVNLRTDEDNCGSCGNSCDACSNGACAAWEWTCFDPDDGDTCDALCDGIGKICTDDRELPGTDERAGGAKYAERRVCPDDIPDGTHYFDCSYNFGGTQGVEVGCWCG
ncbi:MAG: hypothetical protein ACK4YP_22820 [Myxococcota bacterium]